MADFVVAGIIAFVVGAAGGYVWKSKKQGKKCIGCPDSGTCSGSCGSCSGCPGCGK